MANQNFRVKKGLEVGLAGTSLFADVNGVGIGSTAPRRELDVRGKGIFEELEVGVDTTTRALTVTGLSTFNGNMLVDGDVRITGDLEFDDAFIDELNFNVGIGTSLYVGVISAKDGNINGAGIATIGGDPEFNSISVATTSFFGGIATFQSDVSVGGTLTVEGDIILADLDAGNISVGGTVFTDGLNFNVGIGTSLTVGIVTGGEAGFTTAGIGSLTVTGVSSFVGFATFGGNVAIAGTVVVGGDIILDDLESGTIETNEIRFNVGFGTTLSISGLSSLGRITGVGSELTYLPAGSISTSVGIASTIPPTLRPTGEPVQVGDLWFDSLSLRQFTYFYDGDSFQWVDSNPPPIQPNLNVQGQYGGPSTVDIANQPLGIEGINDQILTVTGFGNTVRIGLETNVIIGGNLQLGPTGVLTTFDLDVNGVAEINEANIGIASISNISVDGIDVTTITVEDLTAEELNFNVGVGSTLSVVDLNVSGIASINNAGIATLGGNANFDILQANFAQLGPTTITQELRVQGTFEATSNTTLRDVSADNIEIAGVTTTNDLNVTGVSTVGFLTANAIYAASNLDAPFAEVVLGNTRVENALFVRDQATLAGFTTVQNDFAVQNNARIYNNLTVDGITETNTLSADFVTANEQLTFTKVASGSTINAQDVGISSVLTYVVGVGSTATINTELNVAGVSSFTDDIGFGTARGTELTVNELTVLDTASIPGIPLVGGAASFSSLLVTGLSTFQGITTFTDDVFIDGNLSITGVQTYSGLTGANLNVTGIATVNQLVGTAATIGVASIRSGVATEFVIENLTGVAATITTADVETLGVGVGTVFDLTVYNTIIDSNLQVGTAKSVLTIDESTGKLVWDTPEGAGIATDFAPGNTFYVSPNGSNSNPGTAPTRPWASVAYALGQISASTNDTLIITAGEYTEVFPSGGLEVPAGLTIKGAGQRATIIRPTVATEENDGFRLNDSTTIEDLTVAGFYKPTAGASNYAFQLSTSADIQTKSPYLSRITVINKGRVTSATDPYGFLSAQGGGGGIKIDGSLVTATSLEAAILINEITLFVPNNIGLEMTGGARAEMVNSFIYFANEAVRGEANLASDGSGGFAGSGETRLAFTNNIGNLPSTGTVEYLSPNGDQLGFGTITSSDTDKYVFLDGPGIGYFEPPSRRAAKSVNFLGNASLEATSPLPPLTSAATALDLSSSGSACNVELNADFGFGTGDFTVQFWVYFPTNAYGTDIIDFRDNTSGDTALTISKGSSNFYEVKIGGVSVLQSTASSAVTANWQQIAVSREGTDLRIFVDSDLEATVTNSDDLGTAKPLEIGADFDLLNGFEGYLADLKIDKGAATRRANYTLPSEYLKGDIFTVLLADFNGTVGSTIQPDDIITYQDIRFSADAGYEVDSIRLGDYSQFGADLRSVSSAFQYGAKGVVANGQGVTLRLVAANFNYIGAGGDISNDAVSNHAIEVIPTSNGKVSYVSVDQQGDFRVGDSFFVNQDTGEVSFTADVVDLTSLSSLTISDGANASVITPTSGRFGNVVVSGNTVESVTGDLILRPGGAGEVTIEGNTNIVGILTAQIIEINSIQNGTTAIALDEDSDIRISVSGPEVARFTVGGLGIGTDAPRANVDVIGQTQLENLEVTGIATVGVLSAANIEIGQIDAENLSLRSLYVSGISTLADDGSQTKVGGDLEVVGILTVGENSTTIGGVSGAEFVRAGAATSDFAIMMAGGSSQRSMMQAKDVFGEQVEVTGIASVGILSVTTNAAITGDVTVGGSLNLASGDISADNIDVDTINVSGVTTVKDLNITGVTTAGFITATNIYANTDLTVDGHTELDTLNVSGVGTIGILTSPAGFIDILDFTSATGGSLDINTITASGLITGTDATFTGVLTATTIEVQNIDFDGGSGIGSDNIETRFLDVTGIATIGTLGVSTDLKVDRHLEVLGISTVGFITASNAFVGVGLTVFNLDVRGTANIEGSGIATVGGDARFNSVSIATTSTFEGVATFEDQIKADGPGIGLTVDASAYIGVDLQVGSAVNAAAVNSQTLEVTGIATVGFVTATTGFVGVLTADAATITDLTVEDLLDTDKLNAGVGTVGVLSATTAHIATLDVDTLTSDETSTTQLEVTGVSTVGFLTASDVFVGAALTVGGDLTIEGAIDITGDLDVDDITAQQIDVLGIGTIAALEAPNATLGVATVGFATITNAAVGSALTVYGDLDVEGKFDLTGDITVDDVIAKQLSVAGLATIGSLGVTTDLSVGRHLSVTGLTTVGVLTATDTFVGAALTVAGDTTVGFLTATGVAVGSALTVYGDLDVAGGIDLSGDIVLEDLTARNITASGVITATAGVFTSFTAENIGVGIITAADANVSGAATVGFLTATNAYVGAALTVFEDLTVFGDLNVTGDLSYDEVTGRNINISGVGTITNLVSTAATITVLDVRDGDIGVLTSRLIDATGIVAIGATVGLLTANSAELDDAIITNADITNAEVGVATVGFLTATNISVGAALTVAGDLTVSGNLDLVGDIQLDEIDARSLNVSGIATIGTLGVSTDLTVDRNLEVLGISTVGFLTAANISVGAAVTAPKVEVGFLTAINAEIGILTAYQIGAEILVGGATSITDTLIVVENINATGIITTVDLNVTGVSTLGFTTTTDLFVGGAATVTSDLTVLGDLNVTGDISYDEVTGRNLFISGVGTITNLVATASTVGVLSATDTVIDGTLDVTGDVNLEQNLTVEGGITITGDIDLQKITAESINVSGVGTIDHLVSTASTTDFFRVNNYASIQNLEVAGIASVGILTAPIGTIDILDFTAATGGTLGVSILNSGQLDVTGVATVGFITATTGFVGVLTANRVEADIIIGGGTEISDEQIIVQNIDVSGVTTTQNLNVTGVATVGFLTATNAAIGLGLTVTDLTVLGNASLGGTGIATEGGDPAFNSISVATTSTFGGAATFNDQVEITGAGVGLTVTNGAFVGGDTIIEGNLEVGGNLLLSGDIEFDEVDGRNLNITGVGTIGTLGVTSTLTVGGDLTVGPISISTTGIITATAGIITYYGDGTELDSLPQSIYSATEPTTRENGAALKAGDLWFNSATSGLGTYRQFTYDGSAFVVSGTAELDYSTDQGSASIDLGTEALVIRGDSNILTRTSGKDILVDLTDDVQISGVLTAQDIDTLSDQRYKEHIKPIEDALDKVIQLNGVEFQWKEDGRKAGGVIAQDVEKVLPHLVHGEDPLTVNYNGIIGALVEAVKELKADNDSLRERIEKLEK